MEFFTTFLVCGATLLVLYYLLTKKENRYPPGPFAFPILGNLPQLALTGSITKFAEYYKERYGNVSIVTLMCLFIDIGTWLH